MPPSQADPAAARCARMPGYACPALWLLLALLIALAGCSADPPRRKRSFMASAEGVRTPADVPVGLNPLGSLDTCRPEPARAPGAEHVLISRPEHFTHEASVMISALRESLADARAELPRVAFQLAPSRIASRDEARRMGRECGALIVLWEPSEARTLLLTLPEPSRVPLRDLVQQQLCEFGSHSEQLNILYLTIAGLLSLRENDYDRAARYMTTARSLDNHCLQLPGAGALPAAPAK